MRSIIATTCSFALATVLTSCSGTLPKFSHPTATQEKFLQDRYACYRETAQRVSTASVGEYGGGAVSEVVPNCSAFRACLAARGYLETENGSLVVTSSTKINCN